MIASLDESTVGSGNSMVSTDSMSLSVIAFNVSLHEKSQLKIELASNFKILQGLEVVDNLTIVGTTKRHKIEQRNIICNERNRTVSTRHIDTTWVATVDRSSTNKVVVISCVSGVQWELNSLDLKSSRGHEETS